MDYTVLVAVFQRIRHLDRDLDGVLLLEIATSSRYSVRLRPSTNSITM